MPESLFLYYIYFRLKIPILWNQKTRFQWPMIIEVQSVHIFKIFVKNEN